MRKNKRNNEGKVFWGKSRYIDKDKKPRRMYLVVSDAINKIRVSKITDYKDGQNKYVLDENKYSQLKKKSGVSKNTYSKNKVNKKDLTLDLNNIFDKNHIFEVDDQDFREIIRFISKKKGKK